MDKSEKISWFEQFKIACLKPSQYKDFLTLQKESYLFLAAITLITTILGYGMDVAGLQSVLVDGRILF